MRVYDILLKILTIVELTKRRSLKMFGRVCLRIEQNKCKLPVTIPEQSMLDSQTCYMVARWISWMHIDTSIHLWE